MTWSFFTSFWSGVTRWHSTPVHVVPKPNSTKLRLVVDHSAGEFSLNSMINLDDSFRVKLDGMGSLGLSLLQFRREHGPVPLVVFKSDVSQACRRLPMHPLWQLKQVITVNNSRYVDRCNNFGERFSPYLGFFHVPRHMDRECNHFD